MFNDILEYLKRKPEEEALENKRQKQTEKKRTELEAKNLHSENQILLEAPDRENALFDPFEYLDEVKRMQTQSTVPKPSKLLDTVEKDGTKKEKSAEAECCSVSQENASSELILDEIELSIVLSPDPVPTSPEVHANPHSQGVRDVFALLQGNPPKSQDPLYLCSQTHITSIEAQIQAIRNQNSSVSYISLAAIKASTSLKIEGQVLGYVIRQSPPDRAPSILITDGVDEMLCAVCPSVMDAYKLEKDTIVIFFSPSVWRLPHIGNSCVLNIVMTNIVYVSTSSM